MRFEILTIWDNGKTYYQVTVYKILSGEKIETQKFSRYLSAIKFIRETYKPKGNKK